MPNFIADDTALPPAKRSADSHNPEKLKFILPSEFNSLRTALGDIRDFVKGVVGNWVTFKYTATPPAPVAGKTHLAVDVDGNPVASVNGGDYAPIISAVQATDIYATVPIPLPELSELITEGETVALFFPGFSGVIDSAYFVPTRIGSGDNESITVKIRIDGTLTTGGVFTITSSATGSFHATNPTAITGNNTFTAEQTITLEVTSVPAQFEDAAGIIYLRMRQTS